MNMLMLLQKSKIIFFLLLVLNINLFAQETDADKVALEDPSNHHKNSRAPKSMLQKQAKTANASNQKYLRFNIHDGNLVTGGTANSGILAHHYVSGNPRISWPKGPSAVEYMHSGVFYVAAEVVNAAGDTIHIVSDNYRRSNSEAALDLSHLYGFMPLPKYFNLDQPEATDTPEIDGISEDVGIDGIPNTNDEGEGDGILQAQEDFNFNGKLDTRLQNKVGWFATSDRRETWPRYWPAGSYPGDTRGVGTESEGVRAGRWNGEYGAYVRADQESYYVMDDRENDEFKYYPFDDTRNFPAGRRGLGLTVETRQYQWSSRLAEDIFISIYDITNNGKDLEKCVVGAYIDPDMGGSLSGDDASFDNVDDITYAWNINFRSNKGLPMGYFGFAFLESPGLANDGIDNDADNLLDESQNNGIDDDGDWRGWEDLNNNGQWDTEDRNHNGVLDIGEDANGNGHLDSEPLNDDVGADGLGPDFDDYTGPDAGEANGVPDIGEPNFEFTDNDESDQVGLTSWYLRDVDNTMANDEKYWQVEIQPGQYVIRPGYQRDIAWSYGSGFIKFAGAEKTHRYAIALLFGNDKEDILRNKKTMQVIYDSDYNFAKAPRKPTLTAVAGDKKVYLSWDDRAERSKDPVYGEDFEAYYLYRSSDPEFTEIKTISDAYGNPLLYKPMAIFDKKNGLKGIHPVSIGSELGADASVGVSYNMGNDSGVRHQFIDTTVTNGRTYYYGVSAVDRGYDASFYPTLTDREGLQTISPTETTVLIKVDPLGRVISTDVNTVQVVPVEPAAGWEEPKVMDNNIEHVEGGGTGEIEIEIYNPLLVKNGKKYAVQFNDDGSFEQYDSLNFTGSTQSVTLYAINADESKTALKSLANPDENPLANEFIYEGIRVHVKNSKTAVDTAIWSSGSPGIKLIDKTADLNGVAIQRDYKIKVLEFGADTSINGSKAVNFEVWDVTNLGHNFKVPFRYTDGKGYPSNQKGYLKAGDRIIIVNNKTQKKQLWKFDFRYAVGSDSSLPKQGDVLDIITDKCFDRYDAFTFTMQGNHTEFNAQVKSDMDNIYTVPDPYIAVNTLERKIRNEDEGRGERRIDFVNLPEKCTISIFTVSGKLVRKLEHNGINGYSREAWDLRTRDGLEVAYGVYYWVVDAPGIGKKSGKLGIIK